MKNHYTQIQKPKTNKQGIGVTNIFSQQGQTEGLRTRANTQMEDWFNRVILGNRDVKAFGVIDSQNVDPKTAKEKISKALKGRESYWKKPVLQFDKQGNFIREWPSAKAAKRETGAKNIFEVASGYKNQIYKSSGGYIWKYKE